MTRQPYTMRESNTVKGPMELYEIGDLDSWLGLSIKTANEHILDDPTYATEETLVNGNDAYQTRVRSSDRSKFYVVRLVGSPYGLLAGCTCPAGEHGRRCKHVARVLMVRELIALQTPQAMVDDEAFEKMRGLLTHNPYKEDK